MQEVCAQWSTQRYAFVLLHPLCARLWAVPLSQRNAEELEAARSERGSSDMSAKNTRKTISKLNIRMMRAARMINAESIHSGGFKINLQRRRISYGSLFLGIDAVLLLGGGTLGETNTKKNIVRTHSSTLSSRNAITIARILNEQHYEFPLRTSAKFSGSTMIDHSRHWKQNQRHENTIR